MRRTGRGYNIVFEAGESVSSWFALRGKAGALLYLPGDWTDCDLAVMVTNEHPENGAWYLLKDGDGEFGVDANIVAAKSNTARSLPVMSFAADYVRLLSHDGLGTPVPQAAERVIGVSTKD